MKKIYMICANGRGVEFLVDKGKLSVPAQAIVDEIITTENRDDLSNLFIIGKTQRELYQEAGVSETEIQKIAQAFGEYIDSPTIISWRWDKKKDSETAEDYFERHAQAIAAAGGTILCIKRDIGDALSFQEAASLWGINDSTLRWTASHKRFCPGEVRKTGRNYIVSRAAMVRLYGEPKNA